MVPRDEGYATVHTVGAISVLSSVALLLIGAGAMTVHSHKARLAADMAAVAGAFAHYSGEKGCEEARETAELNGAQMELCSVEGGDVVVKVSSWGRKAQARAGPL